MLCLRSITLENVTERPRPNPLYVSYPMRYETLIMAGRLAERPTLSLSLSLASTLNPSPAHV